MARPKGRCRKHHFQVEFTPRLVPSDLALYFGETETIITCTRCSHLSARRAFRWSKISVRLAGVMWKDIRKAFLFGVPQGLAGVHTLRPDKMAVLTSISAWVACPAREIMLDFPSTD